MANLNEAIEAANQLGVLDDEEVVLLQELNRPRNLVIPYSQYEHFDLGRITDDECKAEFRFHCANNERLPFHRNLQQFFCSAQEEGNLDQEKISLALTHHRNDFKLLEYY
eukprot:gene5789-6487_t